MSQSVWAELKQLAVIVSESIPTRLQVLSKRTLSDSTHDYVMLFKSLDMSEEDAAAHLGKSAKDSSFGMAKNFLRKALLNTLFVLDLESSQMSEYTIALHRSNREAFMVKTLMSLGARTTATDLARESLKLARRFEFLDNQLVLLTVLRSDAAMAGNRQKHKEFRLDFRRVLAKLDAVESAAARMEEVIAEFAVSGSEKPGLKAQVAQYAQEVRAEATDHPSFLLQLYAYRLEALAAQVALQFEDSLSIAESAQTFVEQHPIFNAPGRRAEFALKRIVCLLSLGRLVEGLALIEHSRALFDASRSNWLVFREYEFLLLMHSLRFPEAGECYRVTRSTPIFRSLGPAPIQKWDLFGLYLTFANGQLHHQSGDALNEFLKVIPLYSKDKAGYYVAALILHVLYLLQQHDQRSVGNRLDALRTYRQRYLKELGTEPENIFLRLLLLIESQSFDPIKIELKARPLVEELRSAVSSGPQILPYPYLWDRIILILKEKRSRR